MKNKTIAECIEEYRNQNFEDALIGKLILIAITKIKNKNLPSKYSTFSKNQKIIKEKKKAFVKSLTYLLGQNPEIFYNVGLNLKKVYEDFRNKFLYRKYDEINSIETKLLDFLDEHKNEIQFNSEKIESKLESITDSFYEGSKRYEIKFKSKNNLRYRHKEYDYILENLNEKL